MSKNCQKLEKIVQNIVIFFTKNANGNLKKKDSFWKFKKKKFWEIF